MSYTTRKPFYVWRIRESNRPKYAYEREPGQKLTKGKGKITVDDTTINSPMVSINISSITNIWMSGHGRFAAPPGDISNKKRALRTTGGAIPGPAVFINTNTNESFALFKGNMTNYDTENTELFNKIKEKMKPPELATAKPDMTEIINYIKKLPSIYERTKLSEIASRKGLTSLELMNLVEGLIFDGEISAIINGDELIFKGGGTPSASSPAPKPAPMATAKPVKTAMENLPDTFEAGVYRKMKDTGYLDLTMIADKCGVSTDKVIMIVYRMMSDFDGDIEGDKFKPFSDVKFEAIEKLVQKLRE